MQRLLKFLSLLFFTSAGLFPVDSEATGRECVILMHGITRSHYKMLKLENVLKRHHYVVINRDYPSTRKSINDLANQHIQPLIDECLAHHVSRINFVTHSLSGIILQKYLLTHKVAKLEHIIMLSPPNHGSPIADVFHDNWLYRLITGPAGQELTTDKYSTPNQLHLSPDYRIGVIAGTFNLLPFLNHLFGEPNDGAVSVASARTNIMKDFIVLPVSHEFMVRNALVEKQILHFLEHGEFIHHA